MSTDAFEDSLALDIKLKRVFVLRIWLGMRLLRLALWIIGARAEVIT